VQRIKPSPTLAVTARAAEMRAAGKDIIGLGAGEPDFDTPEHIKEAAIEAIHDGFTKYTAVDGTPALKAHRRQVRARERLSFKPDQILVSCGGKQSFYNLAQALLNPGDEVIIPAPYWVSYPDMVLLADGKPVDRPDPASSSASRSPRRSCEAAITPKDPAVRHQQPVQPDRHGLHPRRGTGRAGRGAARHPQVVIATDDMYEHILWAGGAVRNILNVARTWPRTIVLNGVSKAYSMTGWRIGYAGGPVEVIKAMKKVQSQSTSNPTSISQAADDVELAAWLLERAGVSTVPGSAFGAPGHLRLSFAAGMDCLGGRRRAHQGRDPGRVECRSGFSRE
jgi:aspartate aminotransferase